MATIEEILKAHRQFSAQATGPDCEAFVDQSLQVCRNVVEILQQRLKELGYPVKKLLSPPGKGDAKRIARIESHTGIEIPALLKRFWAVVGGISFVDLEDYSHVAFWKDKNIRGKHGYCDGVHVDACTKDWCQFIIEPFDDLVEDDAEEEFLFSLSPDGYHKDDISGGEGYGVKEGTWQPTLLNFRWSGHAKPLSATSGAPDLLAYLRTSLLECGGFPGLFGHKTFEPIRQQLVESLPVF